MTKRYIKFVIFFISVACNRIEREPTLVIQSDFVSKTWELKGQVFQSDSILEEYSFHDCYCKLSKSGLVIHHVYFHGIEGNSLITTVGSDTAEFILQTWHPHVKPADYSFADAHIILKSNNFHVGSLLQGRIRLTALAAEQDGPLLTLKLMGDFQCVIHDSSYTDIDFRNELARKYQNLE